MPAWSLREAAVVVAHVLVQGDSLLQRPRAVAPLMAARTLVTPVVHVELSTVRPPRDLAMHEAVLLRVLGDAARQSTSGWVQLDMEARPSQRDPYLRLVSLARRSLAGRVKLSVTALAWWCASDHWIQRIDADEVVPMFYRMGSESARFRQALASSSTRLAQRCRHGAAGFAIQDHPARALTQGFTRIYWFDMRHWRQAKRTPPSIS